MPLMPWYRRCCVRCFWGCECVNTFILILALQEQGYIRMNSSCNCMPRFLWLAQAWHAGFWGVGGRERIWEPLELQVWQRELVIYADNRRCKYASISTKKCMTVKSEKAKFLEKSVLKLNAHKHIYYLCMCKHIFYFDVIVYPPFLLSSALQSQEFP